MLQDLINQPDTEQTLVCTIGSVKETQQSRNGKDYQVVNLQDGASVTDAKIFKGNSSLLSPAMAGQQATFKLKYSAKYKGFSGYWQKTANTLQQPVQQALKNLTPLVKPNGNGLEEEHRRSRSMALAYAKDLAVAKVIKPEEITNIADGFDNYIWNGRSTEEILDEQLAEEPPAPF